MIRSRYFLIFYVLYFCTMGLTLIPYEALVRFYILQSSRTK